MFIIKPNELEAVAIAAATGSCGRKYLEGVLAEAYATAPMTLVATDGARLHCINHNNRDEVLHQARMKSTDVKRAIRLAKDAMKDVGKGMRSHVRVMVEKVPVEGKETMELAYSVQLSDGECTGKVFASFTGEEMEGGFSGGYVDYRRIFPSRDLEAMGVVQQIRGFYLSDMVKAGDLLLPDQRLGAALTFHMADERADCNPVIVTLEGYPAFRGLIMPMKRG